VICDKVFSPNMRKPIIAKPPYIAVQIAKLPQYNCIFRKVIYLNKVTQIKKQFEHTL
jgi:hypothetical protein